MDMSTAIDELYTSLRARFRGELIRPGDHSYEAARGIWNSMVARTPALIARCADVPDVQLAVRSAANNKILTAVRCGGHSLAGFSTCDGGVGIDLSRMGGVLFVPAFRAARVAGGCVSPH